MSAENPGLRELSAASPDSHCGPGRRMSRSTLDDTGDHKFALIFGEKALVDHVEPEVAAEVQVQPEVEKFSVLEGELGIHDELGAHVCEDPQLVQNRFN